MKARPEAVSRWRSSDEMISTLASSSSARVTGFIRMSAITASYAASASSSDLPWATMTVPEMTPSSSMVLAPNEALVAT